MTTKQINVPYELDLIHANNWNEYQKNLFYIIRFHLYIEEYQAEDTTYPGEIVATFHTTNEAKIVQAIEREHSVINIDETICSEVMSEEFVSQVESDIKGCLESPSYTLSSCISALLQSKISKSLNFSTRDSVSVTNRVMERFEVTQTIINPGNEKFHAIACYKPIKCDIHLHYIDYLFAEYRTTLFGLRKKKKNHPRPVGKNHTNRILIGQPLFTIRYWELLPKSSNIYSDSQYRKLKEKVIKPEKIVVERSTEPLKFYMPKRPERPTLYALSNIAFPYRWIDRKGDWTIEELKQIELDEADGSGWYFKHGPGRANR
jgi:hypothetical protein